MKTLGGLAGYAERWLVCLELPVRRQLDLILTSKRNTDLPFINGRRLDAQGSGHFGLRSEIGDGLFVGHGAILGAPNQSVKEYLSVAALGLPA